MTQYRTYSPLDDHLVILTTSKAFHYFQARRDEIRFVFDIPKFVDKIFDLLLILTLLPNWTFYLIARSFHRTFATEAACQQRTLTPPDTWFCPTLGLACVLILRPIAPELLLFPDIWVSTTSRYFCFVCLDREINIRKNCELCPAAIDLRLKVDCTIQRIYHGKYPSQT